MQKIIIILLVLFFTSQNTYSQKECSDYVKNKCDAYGVPFKYSGQSKSAILEKGQKAIYKITVYNDFEYRVSICHDKRLKGLFFRIRESDVNKTILYDSSTEEEDYLEKFFQVEESKHLYIEIIVPEGDIDVEDDLYRKRFGCVGVHIEYSRKKDTGFD